MFLRGSHAEVLGRYGLRGNTFTSGHILIEAMMKQKESSPQAHNCHTALNGPGRIRRGSEHRVQGSVNPRVPARHL